MNELAIDVRGLRKSFDSAVVLDSVDLAVPSGSIVALLGPNGAGKTTIVNILATLIRPDGGLIRVAGHDPVTEGAAVRAAIGVTGQFSAVDTLLTGEENLLMMARLQHLSRAEGRRRVAGLLRQFDLTQAAGKAAAAYSGGMRRRLDLAMTLLGSPRVIFLDEPTTGLDPRSRRTMWQLIKELAATGVTILLTTQYLDEADELADQIALLDHGRIVAAGPPAELKQRVPGGHLELQFASAADLAPAACLIESAVADAERLTLTVPSDGELRTLRQLLADLDAANIHVQGLAIHSPDLDDVFFAFTGQPALSVPQPDDQKAGQR